jgi:thiamine pyrophosphate-dependent acetolactate synthase large subunit-like protein
MLAASHAVHVTELFTACLTAEHEPACRWLLLAKLQQQSGDAEGYLSAQNQALELQCTLLEQLKDPGAAAAVGNKSTSSTAAGPTIHAPGFKPKASQGSGGFAGLGSGMAAAIGTLSTAAAKAASICFDLAEFYRKKRQFGKVMG